MSYASPVCRCGHTAGNHVDYPPVVQVGHPQQPYGPCLACDCCARFMPVREDTEARLAMEQATGAEADERGIYRTDDAA